MPDSDRRELTRVVAGAARGRLLIAVQVTDNSAARIMVNMRAAAEDGADIAVIAPPYFMVNATAKNITAQYLQAVRGSPLPVGIYDRGHHSAVVVPEAALRKICAEPKVVLIKDSSKDRQRLQTALEMRRVRPDLRLLNGYEFDCVEYLRSGYDGLLLGGGVFNGYLAGMIIDSVHAGRLREAEGLQKRMNRLMRDVYGGEKNACWLSGLKFLLVEMGIFRTTVNHPGFPLTPACCRAIAGAMEREKDVLLP